MVSRANQCGAGDTVAGFYQTERAYLRAVRAGDLNRVRAILRRHAKLLNEEETLLAPIYFHRPEITDDVIVRLIRAVARNQVSNFGLRRLIHWIGGARLTQLEPEILQFLKHPNREIRAEALSVLSLSWDLRKHRALYEHLLLKDPDESVRDTAATSLGYVLRGTRDRRAVRLLSRTLRDRTETCSVRHNAYEALYDLWFYRPRRPSRPHRHFLDLFLKTLNDPGGWEAGVDWSLVAAIERGTLPRHPLVPTLRRVADRYRSVKGARLKVGRYYVPIRKFLLGVRAGDLRAVEEVLSARPAIVDDDATLFTPLFFRRPEIARYIADRVSAALEAQQISTTGLYGLIHWFGETRMLDLEPDVIRYLSHPDQQMRYIALNVLTLHWNAKEHRHKYEALLLHDPSADVRRLAAAGLGYVLAGTRDRRASRLLAKRVRNRSEDYDVRQVAYEALRDIWLSRKHRAREEQAYWRDLGDKHRRDPGAWKKWVDWDFVMALQRGRVPPGFTAAADRRRPAAHRRAD